MQLPNNFDYEEFGREFLEHYLTRGFGNLNKKEIELLVFTHLSKAGVITGQGSTKLQQTSVLLRIPISRVKTLTYEMQLRSGIVNEKWFRDNFLRAIATTHYKQSDNRISFGVEDPMLRAEIEGRLKSEGRFPDYGLSREILHIGIDDFSYLLETTLSKEERQTILNSTQINTKSLNSSHSLSDALKIFINATTKSAGDEFGRSSTKILFGFLTDGISAIAASITQPFNY